MLKEADSTLTDSKIFEFPISGKTNDANEEGIPLCLSRPVDAEVELNQFQNLASEIAKDLLLLQHGKSSETSDESAVRIGGQVFDVASLQLSVDNESKDFVARFFCDSGATEVRIPGDKLRTWHPKLGEPMEMDSDEDDTSDGMVTHTSGGGCGSHNHSHSHSMPRLFPCTIEKKGRYGYSVTWADQATIIYSMYSLARAAGGVPHQ